MTSSPSMLVQRAEQRPNKRKGNMLVKQSDSDTHFSSLDEVFKRPADEEDSDDEYIEDNSPPKTWDKEALLAKAKSLNLSDARRLNSGSKVFTPQIIGEEPVALKSQLAPKKIKKFADKDYMMSLIDKVNTKHEIVISSKLERESEYLKKTANKKVKGRERKTKKELRTERIEKVKDRIRTSKNDPSNRGRGDHRKFEDEKSKADKPSKKDKSDKKVSFSKKSDKPATKKVSPKNRKK